MKIAVLGAGLMGRAIAFDLNRYSKFKEILVTDKDKKTLKSAKSDFLSFKKMH